MWELDHNKPQNDYYDNFYFNFQKAREVLVSIYVTDPNDIFQLSQLSGVSSYTGKSAPMKIISMFKYLHQQTTD